MESTTLKRHAEFGRRGPWRRFRERHPYASRAVINTAVTGAITAPLFMIGRGKERAARTLVAKMRAMGRVPGGRVGERLRVRGLRDSAYRWRTASVVSGVGGGVLSLGGPLERWDFERQGKMHAKRKAHPVLVVSRRSGEQRLIYT